MLSQTHIVHRMSAESALLQPKHAASRHVYDELLLRKIEHASGRTRRNGGDNGASDQRPLDCTERAPVLTKPLRGSPLSVQSPGPRDDYPYRIYTHGVRARGSQHQFSSPGVYIDHPQLCMGGQILHFNSHERHPDQPSSDVACISRAECSSTVDPRCQHPWSSNVITGNGGLSVSPTLAQPPSSPARQHDNLLYASSVVAFPASSLTSCISTLHSRSNMMSCFPIAPRNLCKVAGSRFDTCARSAISSQPDSAPLHTCAGDTRRRTKQIQARCNASAPRVLPKFVCTCCPRRAHVFDTGDQLM